MGLAGVVMELAGSSPFAVTGPSAAWLRELNGFSWLGSLRASDTADAVSLGRDLVTDWCRRNRSRPGGRALAAEPDVVARRVTSWIVNAGFLLEDCKVEFYRTFTRSLGAEMRALDAASRRAGPGYPRLVCHAALILACLAIEGHDRDRPRFEARLTAELARQVVADGGHISRNPEVVLELLLDLLPIRECYAVRALVAPAALDDAIHRMLAHLRVLRFAPGALARFNGVAGARDDTLSTVLSVEAQAPVAGTTAPGPSGYARLERSGTTVIVDCGSPPPLIYAGQAHAGALSFEMSHDGVRVVGNAGACLRGYRQARADMRATASHATMTIDDQWSARLVHSPYLGRLIGAPPIAGPDAVAASLTEDDAGARLIAFHDGYLSRYGLLHERQLTLAPGGKILTGVDILRAPSGALRLPRDLPVAVRFHAPWGSVMRLAEDGAIAIVPRDAAPWRLSAIGGRLSIEIGTDYTQAQGPAPSRQAVIRAATPGETRIEWKLQRC